MRSVTEERRSSRPIFIATRRAATKLGRRLRRSSVTVSISGYSPSLRLRACGQNSISSATTPVTDLVH